MTERLKPYMIRRNELTVQSGCLLWGFRVVIPPPLRCQVLEELHSGHCGIVRMKEIARSYFWWPGLDIAIEEKAKTCIACQKQRNVPPLAPLHPWEFPEEPWQRIHIDYAGPFEDHMFFIVVDAHSKWPEVAVMKSTTAEKTIEELRSIFSRFGLPNQLVSDNGSQFVSEAFQSFLNANGIKHIRSAPYHAATNGLAERFVQTMKQALYSSRGNGSLNRRLNTFLLAYRNTPHATTKVAPALAMFSRQLRTRLDLLRPPSTKQVVKLQQRAQVERRVKAKLRSFSQGERVLARNYSKGAKWVPATVITQTGPLSYTVQTQDDLIWRRHVDQLLSSANASEDEHKVEQFDFVPDVCANQRPSLESPATELEKDQNCVCPHSPTSSAELSVSTSPAANVQSGSTDRRYPSRIRRPPERLNL